MYKYRNKNMTLTLFGANVQFLHYNIDLLKQIYNDNVLSFILYNYFWMIRLKTRLCMLLNNRIFLYFNKLNIKKKLPFN